MNKTLLLGAWMVALPALAATSKVTSDHCVIEAKKNDRAAKGSNVVVAAGETLEDAIAVEGNVIVKAGATVKDAIALHGSVTVEPGGKVTGNAISIGGTVTAPAGAKVEGSRISLGDSLKIVGDEGKDFEIAMKVGGKNLAQEVLKSLNAKIHDCGVIDLK